MFWQTAALFDQVLPYLLVPVSLLVLTGNFAARRFLETAGFTSRQRQATGWFLAACSAAMLTGLTSCHATTLIIMLLSLIAVLAWRRGGRGQAYGSAATAGMLLPLLVVS